MKPRHERFLLAYQQHGNATRAAVEAGYQTSNAAQAGSRLLKHPEMVAALKAQPVGLLPLVSLPSGVQLGFSYQGRPISPDVALILADAGPSVAERQMWLHGLALLTNLSSEAAELSRFKGVPVSEDQIMPTEAP